MKTILVSRTDRIGDLVLTLPVFPALRAMFPDARLIAHVRSYTAPVLSYCPHVDEIILDDAPQAPRNVLQLAKHFRARHIDTAVVVHPTARALFAARAAGAFPVIGRASNLWQFLLTHPLVQHRSRNEKHECAYNLDLLEPFSVTFPRLPPTIRVHEPERQEGTEVLHRMGLKNPVVIHPGHGGSAHNLSPDQYLHIAEQLQAQGKPVAISLGPQESHLQPVFSSFPILPIDGNLHTLIRIYSGIGMLVAGSTGPMHIAAALGKPVAAFFPPTAAMTPRRWGPVGTGHRVFLPPVDPCRGNCSSCPHHGDGAGCLRKIDLTAAIDWICRHA
jgi:ADP-heptose:LPS heptosyltransferase